MSNQSPLLPNNTLPNNTLPNFPAILKANTYFWRSGSCAAARRRNEKRNLETVEAWFNQIPNAVVNSNSGSVTCEFTAGKDSFRVEFSYSESCKNVYKHLTTTRNGKKSNFSAVKKALNIL